MGRIRARFWDPDGERHSIPTYPWKMAPAHLLTRRQLAARNLTPGRQGVQAQVLWASRCSGHRDGVRAAYLYDVAQARPKRPATVRQLAALERAMAARRRCPQCGTDAGYVLSKYMETCLKCAISPERSAA
ncbi:hypothetical protein GCM10010156_76590 [Planobispora rosea]|uniref:Uncharacterized protein n=1 Tax=Planobispora rosea TaxID=35762 RepID=A0A8J3S730_PLARO|nr:RRQRL motif-containing zinc-binding protein [Planobispora rosea]GGT08193.1 hypothetical protein GCM10010156_76590 [Planobispora rosea]GIH89137.1 hypothetical protein Pro02_75450 [Planobispora rosea]